VSTGASASVCTGATDCAMARFQLIRRIGNLYRHLSDGEHAEIVIADRTYCVVSGTSYEFRPREIGKSIE
jgi:hypothetical protein